MSRTVRSLAEAEDTSASDARSLGASGAPGAAEGDDLLPHVSTVPDLGELARVSEGLESRPASEAVRWAWETYKDEAVLAASFQDCVLIDVAMQVAPDIEVVFLDTQYHFAETLWYVEQVRDHYDLNLRVLSPRIDPDNLWQVDTDACCEMRKVEPLSRALEGKAAWLTGLRRDEAPTRASSPIVGWDVGRGIVKVNPLAGWSHDDIERYVESRGLLQHPLRDKGYPSIGCWPCTNPVQDGDDPRAGRWTNSGKLECGLHGWTPSTTPSETA
ncbi:MAG TPA: phosphoadenylyl-sulfate reductase [Acidimicrobiia bacterium]